MKQHVLRYILFSDLIKTSFWIYIFYRTFLHLFCHFLLRDVKQNFWDEKLLLYLNIEIW